VETVVAAVEADEAEVLPLPLPPQAANARDSESSNPVLSNSVNRRIAILTI
jgi:hypothetical protein